MKIAVMGTGAIGGYVGARLAKAGAGVTFIARGAHLAAIRASGLRVTSPLGDVHVAPATATDDPATVGPVDVVLLGPKLYDLEAAAGALAPMLGPRTAVICLQNGIDAPAIVARLHGPGAAVPCVVMINAELAGPGVVKHNALNTLIVGELDGRKSERLERFATLTSAAGVETRVSQEIQVEIWRKFLLMGAMGVVSALVRLPLERYRECAETWALVEQGMREIVAVAKAEGVTLGEDDVQRASAMGKSMAGPKWKASLTVDLEQGRRLEIEWFSGAVCRLGSEHGIDTPFHRFALGVLKPHAPGAPR